MTARQPRSPQSPPDASGDDFPSKTTVDTFRQSERSFQSSVVQYAEMMGWRVWHDRATNVPRRCPNCGATPRIIRNPGGLPDLILVRRPRVVWVELKSERGRLTDDQAVWLRDLRASEQEVYLWRPSMWQEVEQVLR